METSEIIRLQAQVISQMARLIEAYGGQSSNAVKLMFNPTTTDIANEGKIETADSSEREMSELSDDDFRKLVGYEKEPETNQ